MFIKFNLYFLLKYLIVLIFLIFTNVYSHDVEKYAFLMPNVIPYRPELYLCTPIRVDTFNSYYIVGFEPNSTMETAHHMLLYGCENPGSEKPVWNCGEMAKNSEMEETYTPCKKSTQIMYAWARDAPMLKLPEGVGFKVGAKSKIKYLVLQVHYANINQFQDGNSDNSGIFLHYTKRPLDKLAGVILLGTGGKIKPLATTHMEAVCTLTENKTIHPFAYRTHTHSLGRVVAGYRVREDENGIDQWTLLGKRDPLTPQMFYPVVDTDPIRKGDKLASRCTMVSARTTITHIGATQEDEMCNFYLMYWVDSGSTLDMKYCFNNQGPPFYWYNLDDRLNRIPDKDASSLD
ncbi:peptidylglycine alpha-hydroxylating monooxygenase [Chrysoperla carnea]|uniref:peptidylglycine alpha-hydroxylating monooxygenase n=1 Tax=Chrysoperla carnea TaxID=189513 RepID=UPI001D063E84|nr:peptidylglycine alpha-hydroxylating monooxygenase [Chrysoperla carnea]